MSPETLVSYCWDCQEWRAYKAEKEPCPVCREPMVSEPWHVVVVSLLARIAVGIERQRQP